MDDKNPSDHSSNPYQDIIDQRLSKCRTKVTVNPGTAFPNRPLRKHEVIQFGEETSIDYCVPYFTPIDGERIVGGMMYEQDGIVMSAVFDPDHGWSSVRAYSRYATYEALDDRYWDPNLQFIAEDVDIISDLHVRTLRAIRWPTPIPENFIYDNNRTPTTTDVDITFCSCKNTRGVAEIPAPIDTDQQYGMCISCSGLWGIRSNQENISVQTLLDPNWILEDAVDGIVETTGNSDSDYALLTTAGGSFRRIEKALELLALMCCMETRATEYDPEDHYALLYVREGSVVGFNLWRVINKTQSLMQTYVTPSWRQRGIARAMLSLWINECRKTNPYYVDEPIPAMCTLFEDLGQWNPNSEQSGPAVRMNILSPYHHSPPGAEVDR